MEKQVHFYSGPGLKLTGTLEIPAKASKGQKFPCVILCTGPGGYKDPEAIRKDTLMPGISHGLAKAGYAALRFSYRGVGDSEGPAYRMIPMEQVEDIQNAITFAEQQPEVDVNRIGLWGAATGGSNVSYVAAIDQRVKCIVSENGMADIGRWMREMRRYWEYQEFIKMIEEDRKNRVLTGNSKAVPQSSIILHDPQTAEYVKHMTALAAKNKPKDAPPAEPPKPRLLTLESAEALAAYAPENLVDKISPRAAMWICGSEDTLLPPAQSRSFYEHAKEPKKLVILEGYEHHALYHDSGFALVMQNAIEWYDKYLKSI